MPVELILMEDVDGLGTIGDRVKVADGYARNYLLPKKYATPLTPANLRRLDALKLRLQQESQERLAVAQTMADKIAQSSVTIAVEAAENDRLYGSVGPAQIAEALTEENIEVDRQAILLEEPIRDLGVYSVEVRLHDEVSTTLKVWIVRS